MVLHRGALGRQQRAVVQDVCCFEEGAEAVAARLGWPAHTGLLILRDALAALSRAPQRGAKIPKEGCASTTRRGSY